MKTKRFALCSILCASVIALEVAVIMGGEAIVFLTVLSAFPTYINTRINTIYGILGFATVAITLLLINPHQAAFFALTNGLIGLSLGVSTKYIKKSFFSIILCTAAMFVGFFAVSKIIGISEILFEKPYFIIIMALFCFAYIILCKIVFSKLYEILKKISRSSVM